MSAHPPHPRIPESLRPYIRLPSRDSLTLVTGVLGATTNWIVLRFIAAATATHRKNGQGSMMDSDLKAGGFNESGGGASKGQIAVVLVSWMRDLEFWRTEGMKVVVSL